MKVIIKVITIGLLVYLAGYLFYKHSGHFPYSENPMQYMPNMYHTKALKPERNYEFFKNNSGARVPPAGSLAREQTIYPYPKSMNAADVPGYGNPLPKSREVVMRGQHVYMNNCVVCHGEKGLGDGYIVPPFPRPPSLVSDKIRALKDSQIFHIITVGQNTMNAYGPQIPEKDRWAAIHYVRVLQLADKPTAADLEAFDAIIGGKQ